MNKSIEKAINLTQRLRSVMLQMVALEKEWDEYENSEEYMQSLVSGSLKEQDAAEESTAILAQIDQLLYSLMNMGGEEGWNDEADYEERTQLKLGEALKDRMVLTTAIKL